MLATATTPKAYATREEWLQAATEALRPLFNEHGASIPPNVRTSCGFPGGGSARKRIGECWSPESSGDRAIEVFVSPVLGDVGEVLAVLVHELVHATVGTKHGHKGPFASLARKVGLEGKLTATKAGAALAERLVEVAKVLGPYPHSRLNLNDRKKQTARMILCKCANKACGYTARTTRVWLEKHGAPLCPNEACEGRQLDTPKGTAPTGGNAPRLAAANTQADDARVARYHHPTHGSYRVTVRGEVATLEEQTIRSGRIVWEPRGGCKWDETQGLWGGVPQAWPAEAITELERDIRADVGGEA